MATPRKLLFSLCSLQMASLFAFSASVQFNDPDWYFWFPLYATACVVNLVNGVSIYKIIRPIAKLALWLGVLLFIKVVIEDFVDGIAGFWSSDMRERVVREKFGSGLVVISMFLQLEALSTPNHPTKEKKSES
uniref:Transmembrane protein n=1 Tax=Davidia involucrata TaxID=16924 RepID=A0A5B7BS30_DAVIN